MNVKKLSQSLLVKIVIAIILGIISSLVLPDIVSRVAATFSTLFGNFLGFFIPVLIFALITPAIAGIGRGAGKWLAITTGIAYASTIFSGLIAYGSSQLAYPFFLRNQDMVTVEKTEVEALKPFFAIEMNPPFGVMTALLLAFTIGVAMTAVKSETLYQGVRDLERVIMRVITRFIIPLLPVYIYCIFFGMGKNGNITRTLTSFAMVLVLAVIMTIILLIIQFTLAGSIAGRNPWKTFVTMLPAYGTALGTSSSAATIPVTYECAKKNGVSPSVAGFTVPLCATTHLAGSMMKICLFAFAIVFMQGRDLSPATAIGFILMLGITMVAAPGVPGGAIMAAVGLLGSMLGFDEQAQALMIAAYIAIDSFGTACNVTGDGAIALVVNKLAKGAISRKDLVESTGAEIDSIIEDSEDDPVATPASAPSASGEAGQTHKRES